MDDLRLIRVELPAASFWATDELHALEQYLRMLLFDEQNQGTTDVE